jgi:atypical dual specificity phosphatase
MRRDYSTARIANRIAPRLYLTCLATAKDEILLTNLGITHLVSVIEKAPTFRPTFPLRTLHVSISDHTDEDILTHLPETTSFIRGALMENPKNRVLVMLPLRHQCCFGFTNDTTIYRSIALWASAEVRQ